jgi:hypothetical protein
VAERGRFVVGLARFQAEPDREALPVDKCVGFGLETDPERSKQ